MWHNVNIDVTAVGYVSTSFKSDEGLRPEMSRHLVTNAICYVSPITQNQTEVACLGKLTKITTLNTKRVPWGLKGDWGNCSSPQSPTKSIKRLDKQKNGPKKQKRWESLNEGVGVWLRKGKLHSLKKEKLPPHALHSTKHNQHKNQEGQLMVLHTQMTRRHQPPFIDSSDWLLHLGETTLPRLWPYNDMLQQYFVLVLYD